MPYQLVKDFTSRDLIPALETLLEGARRGQITGIAFAYTRPRGRFSTNVAGLCYRNPTWARGMLGALDDELAFLVHNRDPEDTR